MFANSISKMGQGYRSRICEVPGVELVQAYQQKKQDGSSTSTTQPLQPGSWESSQTDSLASKPSSSATSPERPVLNHKQVQVEPQVFKNIQIFKENKIDDDRVTVGIFYV